MERKERLVKSAPSVLSHIMMGGNSVKMGRLITAHIRRHRKAPQRNFGVGFSHRLLSKLLQHRSHCNTEHNRLQDLLLIMLLYRGHDVVFSRPNKSLSSNL